MFSYNEHQIISAVPLVDIQVYFQELGAQEKQKLVYEYRGLKITITPVANKTAANLQIPQHLIKVQGDQTLAEQFLTAFRFNFLSAGG